MITAIVAAPFVMASTLRAPAGFPCSAPDAKQAALFAKWGDETLAEIRRDFYNPKSGLYSESATAKGKSGAGFCWATGVMFSALNAATAVNPARYRTELVKFAQAIKAYWNPAGPTPGYNASAFSAQPDRYYDDNAWLVRDFADAYRLTGEKSLLQDGENAAAFVWSGWSDDVGGGIYWHEQMKSSKNTCSNGPAAEGFLRLACIMGDSNYWSQAERCWDWVQQTLRDPKDGLYWDNISVTGKISKTKWSYNTALMLEAGYTLLARDKGWASASRVNDLAETLRSSIGRWHGPNGALTDEGPFAHLLCEAWLEAPKSLPEAAQARQAAFQGLKWLHDHGRDPNGRYGKRWDRSQPVLLDKVLLDKWNLIDAASATRAYFVAALASEGRLKELEPQSSHVASPKVR